MINNRVLTLKLFLMRKFLLTFVLNLFAIIATASVQYNGLNYELNGSENTATVLKSESAENLIIPETIIIDGKEYVVTDIDNNAFQGCSQLVSVSIPKTIKSIGTRAFQTERLLTYTLKTFRHGAILHINICIILQVVNIYMNLLLTIVFS